MHPRDRVKVVDLKTLKLRMEQIYLATSSEALPKCYKTKSGDILGPQKC